MNELAQRLGRIEQGLGGRLSEKELLEILISGFSDVDAWLDGTGPIADPHRVDAMIRCPVDKGINPWDVEYFRAQVFGIVICIERRGEDKCGGPLPEDDEGVRRAWAFFDGDEVAQVWLHNAHLLLQQARQWQRVRAGKPIRWGGLKGSVRELRRKLRRTSDCGPESKAT